MDVARSPGLDIAALQAPSSSSGLDASNLRALAPVVWLIGKVQSGKSSIVRVLTGSTHAQIGSGFAACTRTASVYDFPSEMPILRFLDTRGLGEVAYDPTEDMQFAEQQAHLILLTMRAMDPRQGDIVSIAANVRRRHPAWPIVVAQTNLHEGYGQGGGHVVPYPFGGDDKALARVPADLVRSLKYQRSLFNGLPGRAPVVFVPLDFTLAGDGLEPEDYGFEALAEALVSVAPNAMTAVIAAMPGVMQDKHAAAAEPVILSHAMAAAGGDLVPVAGAVAVSAIQTQMLRRLAQIYVVTWDRQSMSEFATALGAGVLTRTLAGFGLRQLAKLIPVYGQTVGAAASAAMSFAVTFALGKAAIYYLHRRRFGLADMAGVARTYQASLRDALKLAREGKVPLHTAAKPAP